MLASVVATLVVRSELREQVDDALGRQARARACASRRPAGRPALRDRFDASRSRRRRRARGGSAPYVQVLDAGRQAVPQRRRRRVPDDPGRRRATSAVAAGDARECLRRRPHGRRRPRARAARCRSPAAARSSSRAASRRVDSTLSRLRLAAARAVRRPAPRSPRCSGGCPRARSSSRSRDLTDAAEHITATEDLGRRIEVRSDDEVGRAGGALQHDARHARALGRRAAPARRRRVARAAHAGHGAAHEHRGAADRRRAAARTRAAAARGRARADRGARAT